MSIASIASTALYSVLSGLQGSSNTGQGKFQQFQSEFQQLGQDLQSGNLTQAQQDYATLSQNFPNATQSSSSSNPSAGNNPIAQAFNQLSQDLQTGNLSAAQQDYANIQQDFQQQGANRPHFHHHRHGGGNSGEQSQINQDFSSLASALQSGDLSGAQTAFASLQQDLEQIGGFSNSTSAGGTGSASSSGSGSLSVTA
jgi:hypothetical protein